MMTRIFTVPDMPTEASGIRLTLINIKVRNGRGQNNGGAIYVGENGRLGLANAEVSNSLSPRNGGCIYTKDARTSLILRSEIKNCQAGGDGGGIYVDGGSLDVLAGTSISNNSAIVNNGGNIVLAHDARAMISGSVSSGSAVIDGGGIYMLKTRRQVRGTNRYGHPILTLGRSASMRNNKAGDDGGAIFFTRTRNATSGGSPDITISGAEIMYNTAVDIGGGIANSTIGADIIINDGSKISNNSSGTKGGAMNLGFSTININGHVEIKDNTASELGAGIRVHSNSSLTIRGTSLAEPVEISDNTINSPGQMGLAGAGISSDRVEVRADFLKLHHNRIFGEHSKGGGMAISGARAVLENTYVTGNQASVGAGVYVSGRGRLAMRAIFRRCDVVISGSTVTYCSKVSSNRAIGSQSPLPAPGSGGGIYITGGASADIRTTQFSHNVAASVSGTDPGRGGAIGVDAIGGTPNVLVLNAMIESNKDLNTINIPAIYADGGNITIRNSTFRENPQSVWFENGTNGVFNNNAVVDNTVYDIVWPSSTTGHCNVFDDPDAPLPVGSGNVHQNISLDGNGHPGPYSNSVINHCSSGPAFDILGTRRPVSQIYDKGAVEYVP